MSNEKHYPTHPGAEHPPIMTCEIPLEEYESLKRENAELKQKLHDAEMRADLAEAAETERKIDLENYKADVSRHARNIYYRHNRQTLRALWIARAKRAIEKIAWFKLWNASISTMNPEDGARQEYDKWKKALGKFLAKAEEYK